MNSIKCMYTFLNEMWNAKTEDLDELHLIFSPDLIAASPLGSKIGVDDLKQTNIVWSQGFPDMALSNIELTNSGELVVAQWKSQGTNTNFFNDYKPTGRKVEYEGVTIFQFDGKKVIRYKCIINMLDVYEQLGFFLEQESYDGQKIIRHNHTLLLNRLKSILSTACLSNREFECLSFFIHGWSAKQIGMHLKCSYRTIQNHLSNAMDKLHCHSKHQLFELMNSLGILPLLEDLYKICFNSYFNHGEDVLLK